MGAPLINTATGAAGRCAAVPALRPPMWGLFARLRGYVAASANGAAAPDAGGGKRGGLSTEQEEHSRRAWEHWRALGAPKYVCAPMVDGSELAFRALVRRYGVELAYTPMLHSRMFTDGEKYRKEQFGTNEGDRPVIAQFCANNPELLVKAARYVEGEVDAIDLNLGCPQGIARRGRYGSFLMEEWDLLRRIVGTAKKELQVPIWCKIRIFPDVEKTVAYAKMLVDAGASLIAVHGRTREQKGKNPPPADWDQIKAVKNALDVPVIANGNVCCKEDADEAMRYTGADAVMAAWALLDNPAMFKKDGQMPSRLELLREYLDIAEEVQTPMKQVRLHVFKLIRSRLDVNMDLNEATAKCRSIDDFRQLGKQVEERTDFDGVSFEERQKRGMVVVNAVAPRKKRKVESEKIEVKRGVNLLTSLKTAV